MLPPLTGLDGRRGVVDRESRGRPGRWPDARASARRHQQLPPGDRRARFAKAAASCRATPTTSLPVAIVNETMAKRYWPGASPIGKRVRFTDQEIWREVVGIIGDVKHWGLDAPVNPELYVPTTQFPAFALTWVLLDQRRSARARADRAAPRSRDRSRTCRCSRCARWRKSPRRSVERRRWTMTLLAVLRGAGAGAGGRRHLRRDVASRVAAHAGDRRAPHARREARRA